MTGTPVPSSALETRENRADLRYADTRHDARRANRAGPDADLYRIGPILHQIERSLGSDDVAPIT